MISFHVLGHPKGQPRVRAYARMVGGKARGGVFDPGTADGWKQAVYAAAIPHKPTTQLVGAVEVWMDFYIPRPASHYGTGKNAGVLKDSSPKRYTAKPDLDNLEKCVLDVLTDQGWWIDDAQVDTVHKRKHYAAPGDAGAKIVVCETTPAS